MTHPSGPGTAGIVVFVLFFAAAILLGASAGWRTGRGRHGAAGTTEEWGLGGRSFGTWITWFLVGGDFYTAYTVIAVPALVYATGAYGFWRLHVRTLLVEAGLPDPDALVDPLLAPLAPEVYRYQRDLGHPPHRIAAGLGALARRLLGQA